MDVVPAFSGLFPASFCCHGFPSSSTLGPVPVPFTCPTVMLCLSHWDLTSVPTQSTHTLRLCPRTCDLISVLCYPKTRWIAGDWNGATGDGWVGVPAWCYGMDEVLLFPFPLPSLHAANQALQPLFLFWLWRWSGHEVSWVTWWSQWKTCSLFLSAT